MEELFAHGLTPPNVLCVEYEPGTTVIWDNRLVLHRSTPQEDYLAAAEQRLMHRVFIVEETEGTVAHQEPEPEQQASKL